MMVMVIVMMELENPELQSPEKNVEKVKDKFFNNHRITIREIVEEIGISYGSNEEMRRMAAKFLFKLLNIEEKTS